MWTILLFGAPQFLRDNVAAQIPRRKNRALLCYLAAHSKPLTRDQILALFFIDHERSAAHGKWQMAKNALTISHQPSALSHYRGDFLQGFTLDDVPEFDDWVARERERYRALAVRGRLNVAQAYENESTHTSGSVKVTGTHTGEFNPPMPGLPRVAATGNAIANPTEHIEVEVQKGKLTEWRVEPLPNGGVAGILTQMGVTLPHA